MINQTINHLPFNGQLNLPGLCYIKAIPIKHIHSMPSFEELMASHATAANAQPMSINQIVPLDGLGWKDISKEFNLTGLLTIEDTSTQQGKFFKHKVTFEIAGDDWANRGQIIQAYDNYQWVVQVKVIQGGAIRILGSRERGCDFSATQSSGKGNSPNLFTCQFNIDQPFRAIYAQ